LGFYDPYDDAVLEDPVPVYARLRREAPVLHLERYDAWFLARFEDVWRALQSRGLSVAMGITPSNLLLGAPPLDRMPSQMDPPRHTELRALVARHFRPTAARENPADERPRGGTFTPRNDREPRPAPPAAAPPRDSGTTIQPSRAERPRSEGPSERSPSRREDGARPKP